MLDQHLGSSFIKPPQTHDRIAERRDVVHPMEHPVLTDLGLDDDGADSMNLHLRLIAEPHHPSGRCVQIGEQLATTGHVVSSTSVQVPPIELLITAGLAVQKSVRLGLVDGDVGRLGEKGRSLPLAAVRVGLREPTREEQCVSSSTSAMCAAPP